MYPASKTVNKLIRKMRRKTTAAQRNKFLGVYAQESQWGWKPDCFFENDGFISPQR